MGKKDQDTFKFYVPVELAKGESEDEWRVKGIASTGDRDLQGETVSQSGLDISPLKQGKGLFNNDHQKGPENILGKIDYAQNTMNGLYVEGYLFKHQPRAQAFFNIMRSLKKADKNRVQMSIEGKIIKRSDIDKSVIARARVEKVALTLDPVNTSTYAEIAKSLSVERLEVDECADTIEEVEKSSEMDNVAEGDVEKIQAEGATKADKIQSGEKKKKKKDEKVELSTYDDNPTLAKSEDGELLGYSDKDSSLASPSVASQPVEGDVASSAPSPDTVEKGGVGSGRYKHKSKIHAKVHRHLKGTVGHAPLNNREYQRRVAHAMGDESPTKVSQAIAQDLIESGHVGRAPKSGGGAVHVVLNKSETVLVKAHKLEMLLSLVKGGPGSGRKKKGSRNTKKKSKKRLEDALSFHRKKVVQARKAGNPSDILAHQHAVETYKRMLGKSELVEKGGPGSGRKHGKGTSGAAIQRRAFADRGPGRISGDKGIALKLFREQKKKNPKKYNISEAEFSRRWDKKHSMKKARPKGVGSRGGKVVGYTRSGKPKYQKILNAAHKMEGSYGAYNHEARGTHSGRPIVTERDKKLIDKLHSHGLSEHEKVVFYDSKRGRHAMDDMMGAGLYTDEMIKLFKEDLKDWDLNHEHKAKRATKESSEKEPEPNKYLDTR